MDVNKKVKLCFNIDKNTTNIDGVITEMNDTTIFVKPINLKEDMPNNILEIQKDDKDVNVISIEKGTRNCLTDDENVFKIFIFDEDEDLTNKKVLEKYIKNIIPNTNQIIDKIKNNFVKENNKSLQNIIEELSYYNINLEDLTYDNFKDLIAILYKHNQKLSLESEEEEKIFKIH